MADFMGTLTVTIPNLGGPYAEMAVTQSPAKVLRETHRVMDLVPHQMFILEPDFSACFENKAATDYFGDLNAASPREQIAELTHPEDLDQALETTRIRCATACRSVMSAVCAATTASTAGS